VGLIYTTHMSDMDVNALRILMIEDLINVHVKNFTISIIVLSLFSRICQKIGLFMNLYIDETQAKMKLIGYINICVYHLKSSSKIA
jgi:hypothetical protein